ncbi:hypothetical protein CMV_026788 [Castanea mollissima]|uniref:Protein PLANT CADMIUM RESISTANCE 10 n=1 Tax=Castanea mollissima TaxID=60419 RepID=A0A8J4VEJ1_9ROSI|nr:hypothetical protein CMV_026788 [Castanea mollissima]
MKNQSSYVPPSYVPLEQSDAEAEIVPRDEELYATFCLVTLIYQKIKNYEGCIGLFCPCFLFGKNAEFLGSGTLMGSCATHFVLWALFNSLCCLLTEGIFFGFPGCFVACYACGYRQALRSKYNLQEAPCGDFVTHFFCHLCAICQEYREIRERSGNSGSPDLKLAVVTAPPAQTMESISKE